ncbi:hypothetical protein [Edaphosphingomonas haloaromaticamans]|uniref:Uncharacterized protein n=1 Tax=Edaphosphingomonas haloaromaticamans TaxID=653954 RepID=A0A1S1HJK8_9SPHN|nr:hypothetical protein [Sphingomonas haloaromaticamans]OHT21616.1 hypothetical protein BHE75_03627 [Sphingomonas haloaromaticamans]
MPRYEVEVKAFITVIVDADDAGEAREHADRFVEWLSPTIEQIDDYSADHEPIDTDTGPFGIDGESCVEETDG